jgi:hypothetical protein
MHKPSSLVNAQKRKSMDDSEGAGGSVIPRILTTTPNVKNVDQPSITSVMVSI